jgi:hypothetical protein
MGMNFNTGIAITPRRIDSIGPPVGYSWTNAEAITYVLEPNNWGRINEATLNLPEIQFGGKVATGASWGCANYPAGLTSLTMRNNTWQTLAVRYTVIENLSNRGGYYDNGCHSGATGYRRIWFYTYDAAQGIDATWANTQSDSHRIQAGGHAKRGIGFGWSTGLQQWASHTVPGTTGVLLTLKIEHLIWNPGP